MLVVVWLSLIVLLLVALVWFAAESDSIGRLQPPRRRRARGPRGGEDRRGYVCCLFLYIYIYSIYGYIYIYIYVCMCVYMRLPLLVGALLAWVCLRNRLFTNDRSFIGMSLLSTYLYWRGCRIIGIFRVSQLDHFWRLSIWSGRNCSLQGLCALPAVPAPQETQLVHLKIPVQWRAGTILLAYPILYYTILYHTVI